MQQELGPAASWYTSCVEPDREARARAILEAARAQRKRTPRGVWIAALAAGALCVVALAVGWLSYRGAGVDGARRAGSGLGSDAADRAHALGSSSWSLIGLALGVVVGVALGTMIGMRRGRAESDRA